MTEPGRDELMRLIPDLAQRSEAPELMDDHTIGGAELTEALAQLRRINLFLGAAFPTLEGVARLWRQAGTPSQLSLLDVGAGTGDANRLLLRWATLRRVHMRITLLDIHPDTCAAAAAYYQDEPRIQVQQGDLFHLPPHSADIVTASLVLHHFATDQLAAVMQAMARASRLGVVINDLHRHPLAWMSIRLITALLSRNRMIRHDAPLSVWRGFRVDDFERLRARPGLEGLRCWWRPMFRYLVIVPGSGSTNHPHPQVEKKRDSEDQYV
jgi:SAM-dependent methyltransferase